MTDSNRLGTSSQRREIARAFHEEYEWLAPEYGWTTQERSRVHWDDLPENQRKLMVHVVGNLLARGLVALPDVSDPPVSCDPPDPAAGPVVPDGDGS